MTAYVTMDSMTKRFALITHRFIEFDLHLGDRNQIDCASAARNTVIVRPGQEQGSTGSRRSIADSTQASARAQACDAHGQAGARGEGANMRDGEVERW
jgi:hypothetical protein